MRSVLQIIKWLWRLVARFIAHFLVSLRWILLSSLFRMYCLWIEICKQQQQQQRNTHVEMEWPHTRDERRPIEIMIKRINLKWMWLHRWNIIVTCTYEIRFGRWPFANDLRIFQQKNIYICAIQTCAENEPMYRQLKSYGIFHKILRQSSGHVKNCSEFKWISVTSSSVEQQKERSQSHGMAAAQISVLNWICFCNDFLRLFWLITSLAENLFLIHSFV